MHVKSCCVLPLNAGVSKPGTDRYSLLIQEEIGLKEDFVYVSFVLFRLRTIKLSWLCCAGRMHRGVEMHNLT